MSKLMELYGVEQKMLLLSGGMRGVEDLLLSSRVRALTRPMLMESVCEETITCAFNCFE
jgi:hypothetical protein